MDKERRLMNTNLQRHKLTLTLALTLVSKEPAKMAPKYGNGSHEVLRVVDNIENGPGPCATVAVFPAPNSCPMNFRYATLYSFLLIVFGPKIRSRLALSENQTKKTSGASGSALCPRASTALLKLSIEVGLTSRTQPRHLSSRISPSATSSTPILCSTKVAPTNLSPYQFTNFLPHLPQKVNREMRGSFPEFRQTTAD